MAGPTSTGSPAAVREPGSWFPAFRVGGIDVRIHAFAVPLLAAFAFALSDGDVDRAVTRFAALLTMLGAVLLHELSHGFVARAAGLRVLDVRVHALGGVARIEQRPGPLWRPRDEWLPSLAGPCGNLLAAAVTALGFVVAGRDPLALSAGAWASDPAAAFLVANLGLGVLNLVPAFPSDGGRVLRALLARRWTYLTATRVALVVGTIAVAIGTAALLARFGSRVLVGVVPLVVLLGLYGFVEHSNAVARAAYERFCRFVLAEGDRLPTLKGLPRDAHGLPVATAAVFEDSAVRDAWLAFTDGPRGP